MMTRASQKLKIKHNTFAYNNLQPMANPRLKEKYSNEIISALILMKKFKNSGKNFQEQDIIFFGF